MKKIVTYVSEDGREYKTAAEAKERDKKTAFERKYEVIYDMAGCSNGPIGKYIKVDSELAKQILKYAKKFCEKYDIVVFDEYDEEYKYMRAICFYGSIKWGCDKTYDPNGVITCNKWLRWLRKKTGDPKAHFIDYMESSDTWYTAYYCG